MSNSIRRILITPLNWGLGHATRCIPIIRTLQEMGIEVVIASDGPPLDLLKKEFPGIVAFELPGYNIDYKGHNFAWTMLRQSAKVIAAIALEKKAVKKIRKEAEIDAIISDNRFGCYSRKIPSVFITHQVNLISPVKALERPVNLANHQMIQNFREVWVPDFPGPSNLSGTLSNPIHFKKVRYLGALSRMKKSMALEKKYDVVAVLSGPEPKRSEFEHQIFAQSIKMEKKFLIVRGLPGQWEYFHLTPNVEVVAFLTSGVLNKAMLEADVIVSRSGYSTILDLVYLEKPALLVPTPGQTEQEYLAQILQEKGLFATQQQDKFDLSAGIHQALQLPGLRKEHFPEINLRKVLEDWLGDMNLVSEEKGL